jgi:hypothetical protein
MDLYTAPLANEYFMDFCLVLDRWDRFPVQSSDDPSTVHIFAVNAHDLVSD